MTTLIVYAGEAEPDSVGTRTGGVPLAHEGFVWPRCRECSGNMQFLAQVSLPGLADRREPHSWMMLIFMCQNDPGLCEEWGPYAGGNRAMLISADGIRPVQAPSDDEVTLGAVSSVGYVNFDGVDYAAALKLWRTDNEPRSAVGQLGGLPWWLQADETPTCQSCSEPMTFVAQLDEGHDHRTSANFGGGGCGYAFVCWPCQAAFFLWQR